MAAGRAAACRPAVCAAAPAAGTVATEHAMTTAISARRRTGSLLRGGDATGSVEWDERVLDRGALGTASDEPLLTERGGERVGRQLQEEGLLGDLAGVSHHRGPLLADVRAHIDGRRDHLGRHAEIHLLRIRRVRDVLHLPGAALHELDDV